MKVELRNYLSISKWFLINRAIFTHLRGQPNLFSISRDDDTALSTDEEESQFGKMIRSSCTRHTINPRVV